jgi:hypothetical protein
MRQTISGLVAAVAVVAAGTVPASACGLFESTCGQSYVAAPVYSGCNCGGGYTYERLADPAYQYGAQSYPAQQYYYVNQGPTYSGPGDFAPRPTYQEGGVYDHYRYRSHHYRPWHAHTGYWGHPAMHYGYERRGYEHRGYEHHGYEHHGYEHRGYEHHGYAPYHSMRYGYHGTPHQYGYREHTLRRYY